MLHRIGILLLMLALAFFTPAAVMAARPVPEATCCTMQEEAGCSHDSEGSHHSDAPMCPMGKHGCCCTISVLWSFPPVGRIVMGPVEQEVFFQADDYPARTEEPALRPPRGA